MKRVRRKRQANKINFKILKALFILLLSSTLVFIIAWSVTMFFSILTFKPMSLGMDKLYWNGVGAITILSGKYNTNRSISNISLISIDSKNGITSVNFPNNLIFGDIKANSIYALNSYSGANDAMLGFVNQMKEQTGIQIDGYFLESTQASNLNLDGFNIDNVSSSKVYGGLATGMSIRELSKDISRYVYTNIDPKSLFYISQTYSNSTKYNALRLSSADLEQEGDGVVLTNSFLNDISAYFIDSSLQSEHARVSIYNGTNENGVGNLVGSLIQNQGDVVDLTNATSPQSRTYIYCANPQNFPYTINKLEKEFNASLIKQQYSITSDITIVLGSNSLKYL